MSKRTRHRRYPAVEYNVGLCEICQQSMSFRDVREAVYWLPDMDKWEYGWAKYSGFEHKMAHRPCWRGLKVKRQELIRLCSFKNQEPRSMGQVV